MVKEVRQMVFASAFFHAAISVFYDVGFHGLIYFAPSASFAARLAIAARCAA